MSYANAKPFILILLCLSVAQSLPVRSSRQFGGMGMPGMGGMGGMAAPSISQLPGMGGMGGMPSQNAGMAGLADIGIDIGEFKDMSKNNDFPVKGMMDVSTLAGSGGSDGGFGGMGAASSGLSGSSMADVGANTMWSDFQDIIKSVGAVKNPGMETIGIKKEDFPSPADFSDMTSMAGISGGFGDSANSRVITKQVQGSFKTTN